MLTNDEFLPMLRNLLICPIFSGGLAVSWMTFLARHLLGFLKRLGDLFSEVLPDQLC
jgi:hypothetical protein